MGRFVDLIGKRFGRLVVVKRQGKQHSHVTWCCQCDCGMEVVIASNHLRTGHTVSCGCARVESMAVTGRSNRTHGHTIGGVVTPEFRVWTAMHNRCMNTKAQDYARYGGRGIRICSRWMFFAHFFTDMGPRPSGTSIDRYPDQNGHYEPSNCRWATPKEQSRNQRSNIVLTLDGRTQCAAGWAEECGLKADTVRHRIARGDSPSMALRQI